MQSVRRTATAAASLLVAACAEQPSDTMCPSPGVCASDAGCSESETYLLGECRDTSRVAFVAGDGSDADNSTCASEAPCATVEHALELHPSFLVLRGHLVIVHPIQFRGWQGTVIAEPGTTVTSAMPASGRCAISVEGSDTSVTIHDLVVENATSCAIGVPKSTGAPSLTLVDVTVTGGQVVGISVAGGTFAMRGGKITNNTGGGVDISDDTAFSIENVLLTGNGDSSSAVGAIKVNASGNAQNRLTSLKIIGNFARDTTAPAIDCTSAGTIIENTVIENNGFLGPEHQTRGNCTFR